MKKAIEFARKHTTISDKEEQVIHRAKDTLLFHNGQAWKKIHTDDLFDVTMGSFDGAETCEMVGAYILSEIGTIIPSSNIGLYRDGRLAIVHESPRKTERIKKASAKNSKNSASS